MSLGKILHIQLICLSAMLGCSWQGVAVGATSDEGISFFEKKIRPVLVRECYGCHSNKSGRLRARLAVDSRTALMSGGVSGPAVVPGNLDESLLWSSINYESYEMPPSGKLPDNVLADFKQWIEMGAPIPSGSSRKLNSTITSKDIKRARNSFWAYQKPQEAIPPEVEEQSWPKTEIDRFILAELEANGMEPAKDAEPYTVLKRLTYDLVGLPPTPTQIDYFLDRWQADPDDAVELVVDTLLQSDRFGERWGRHWLDVARYAESTGKEINMTFPYAWRYRNYVIDSFNEDKPYDRFLMEQIAGDLLPVNSDEQWSENLVATTFLAIGPKTLSEQSAQQFVADLVDEQIDATTRVFLGTSVACARCHDHKFDPIPQSDYYAMAGIFENTNTYYGTIGSRRNRRRGNTLLLPTFDEASVAKAMDPDELARLKEQLRKAQEEEGYVRRIRQRVIFRGETGPDLPDKDDPILNIRTIARLGQQVAQIQAKLATVDASGQPVGKCMGVQDSGSTRNATLYIRGELDQPAQTVARGIPQVLSKSSLRIKRDSSGRLELAQWMASERNSLTSRVMANRIWKHLLGRGIVSTMENFGSTGQPPSHPELLDYLANRFVDSGWSVKDLIREIATSRIYRTSSSYHAEYFQQDPENKLLWRMTPRRIDAEAIRDAMLFVSGEIDLQRPTASLIARVGDATVNGGQVIPENELGSESGNGNSPMMSPFNARRGTRGFQASFGGQGFRRRGGFGNGVPLDVPNENYRSVFMPIVRDFTPRSLEVFDFPDASMIVGSRYESNTANQALYMLNNPLVLRTSAALAKKVSEETDNEKEQLQSIFLQIYGRPASQEELRAAFSYVRHSQSFRSYPSRRETLAQVCQALFASAEFRYQY